MKSAVLFSCSIRLHHLTFIRNLSKFRLQGHTAAVFSPFRSDGSLCVDGIPYYATHLNRTGVRNVFVTGTTGEFPSLSTKERQHIAEAWMSTTGLDKIVIHIGTSCLHDSKELANHAEKIGAHAIAAIAPYFPPQTVDALVEYMSQVAAAAPHTPFYYYHFPYLTRTPVAVTEFLQVAAQRIPTLCGVKYTDSDVMELAACTRVLNGDLQVIIGHDGLYYAAKCLGVNEPVFATCNFMPGCYRRLDVAMCDGDESAILLENERIYKIVNGLEQRFHSYGLISWLKAAAAVVEPGLKDVIGPPRLPERQLMDSDLCTLKQYLNDVAFFDWRM